MVYRVYNIDYCIEPEDLEINEDDFDKMVDENDFDDFIEEKMNEILEDLPDEIFVDFVDDGVYEDELEFEGRLADAVSDLTGWLVSSFEYEKVKVA